MADEFLGPKDTHDLLSMFDQKKVLIIGDLMVDRYIRGEVSRVSPEAPVPVVLVNEKEELKLGGAGNAALNLKGLGANVTVCGILQSDHYGWWVVNELERVCIKNKCFGLAGTLHDRCAAVEGPTISKTRVIAGGQQICRIDREGPGIISDVKLSDLLDLSEYDAIFISDYGKGIITHRLMSEVRRSGIPFYCDPKDTELAKYAGSCGITPNEKEAQAFVFPYPDDSLQYNLCQLSIGTCLITRGDKGVSFWDANEGAIPLQIGAYQRELADACGAGDTAFAVYGLSKTCGAPTAIAAGLANLAGSLVCEHPGVVPITKLALVSALPEGE